MHSVIFALLSAVNATKDIAYAADAVEKHRLDVYAPAGAHNAPVLLFVHGGGFVEGDRRDYNGVGTALAAAGIVAVLPSYRLYPQADARGAAADVAAATVWTANHIATYGGNARGIIMGGHSAGAFLAALVALDPEYLQALGAAPSIVRGLIGFSGTYDVRDIDPEAAPPERQLIGRYFGSSQETRAAASPITYAAKLSPPVALFCGGVDDAPACGQRDQFFAALVGAGAIVQMDADASATHTSVISNLMRAGTPEQQTLLDFLRKYAR